MKRHGISQILFISLVILVSDNVFGMEGSEWKVDKAEKKQEEYQKPGQPWSKGKVPTDPQTKKVPVIGGHRLPSSTDIPPKQPDSPSTIKPFLQAQTPHKLAPDQPFMPKPIFQPQPKQQPDATNFADAQVKKEQEGAPKAFNSVFKAIEQRFQNFKKDAESRKADKQDTLAKSSNANRLFVDQGIDAIEELAKKGLKTPDQLIKYQSLRYQVQEGIKKTQKQIKELGKAIKDETAKVGKLTKQIAVIDKKMEDKSKSGAEIEKLTQQKSDLEAARKEVYTKINKLETAQENAKEAAKRAVYVDKRTPQQLVETVAALQVAVKADPKNKETQAILKSAQKSAEAAIGPLEVKIYETYLETVKLVDEIKKREESIKKIEADFKAKHDELQKQKEGKDPQSTEATQPLKGVDAYAQELLDKINETTWRSLDERLDIEQQKEQITANFRKFNDETDRLKDNQKQLAELQKSRQEDEKQIQDIKDVIAGKTRK
ncbi:MAG: hypothetical protein US49_C0003G0090 [candidate division TM6 bacterium GW2011_GWF2_37_49]|nr:MAG: hypothetical protein US49_C0003G0090 [candidate division TM6 bacterium GW2011_GWF2_37_49]